MRTKILALLMTNQSELMAGKRNAIIKKLAGTPDRRAQGKRRIRIRDAQDITPVS